MAWLNSTPKTHKKDDKPKSRLSQLDDDHPSKQLPESSAYLTLCFGLLGYCSHTDMGSAKAFTWSEIESFSNQSGYKLNGWESEQMLLMSRAYANMSSKASELNCPSPYKSRITSEEEKQIMRDRVNKQLDAFLA